MSLPALHDAICEHLKDSPKLQTYMLSVFKFIDQYYSDEKTRGEIMAEYLNQLYWSLEELELPSEIAEQISKAWKPRSSYRCDRCSCGGNVVEDCREGYTVCVKCGNAQTANFPQKGYVYTPETTPSSSYTYKRVNHFREWLQQAQGRENTDLTDAIEAVRSEMKINRISNPKREMTPAKVRQYLKKRNMARFYEHVNRIFADITGVEPPQLSTELEETFIVMFKQIQEPFERNVPSNRKNFLSYSYVLNKMCGILQMNEMQQYFPLLKSRDKLQQQDTVWRAICAQLEWPFSSSF